MTVVDPPPAVPVTVVDPLPAVPVTVADPPPTAPVTVVDPPPAAAVLAPSIDDFSLSQTAVPAGGETRLRWQVKHASSVEIEPGIGPVENEGEILLSPLVSTTYRLSATGPGGSNAQNADVQVVAYDWRLLDLAIDTIGLTGLTNFVLAVEIDGRQVYARGVGNLTPDSAVQIASASKAVAASAILTLVDEGRLDLDAPVSQYLGSTLAWPIDKAAITMRMLLNHTAGLDPAAPCLQDVVTITMRDCVQQIADSTLLDVPGAAFHYGGAGYQVAGFAAATIAGEDWKSFFDERIAVPLGAPSLRFLGVNNPLVAGSAQATAGDYLKFLKMFVDRGRVGENRILSDASVALARQSQVTGVSGVWLSPYGIAMRGYSFGWWLDDPVNYPGSRGPELSDAGLFGTVPWVDDDKNYGAVLLTQDGIDLSVAAWKLLKAQVLLQIDSQP